MIRRALEVDLAAIARLNASVLELHAKNEPWAFRCPVGDREALAWFAGILKDPAVRFWVAEDDSGSLLGYLFAREVTAEATWMRPSQHHLMLEHVVVDAAHRRCGIGHRLVSEFLAEAKRAHIPRTGLFTWSFNKDAHRFFHRFGFEAVHQRMELAMPVRTEPDAR
jgi:ribosomal protein S18 acetylase RimI-like enzyme